MSVDTEAAFDDAEKHWPAMVNRNRTRLDIVRMPRNEFERRRNEQTRRELDELQASGYPMASITYEPEPVGEIWLMAYDPVMDRLFVWEPD